MLLGTRDDFDDETFVNALTADLGTAVRQAWQNGDRTEAMRLLQHHFQTRPSPRWFFDGRDGRSIPDMLPWPSRDNGGRAALIETADKLLEGVVSIGGGVELHLGPEFEWRTAETTELGVPGNGFRRADFFLTLARAHQYTGDRRYLDGFRAAVERWLVRFPFRVSEDFSPESLIFSAEDGFKSLPTGVRLYNWLSCLATRAPYHEAFSPELFFRFLKEICYTALQYLRYREATYRPGNHHIMRCGTIPTFVAVAIPELAPLADLLPNACRTIERHVAESILRDGGYEERSASYTMVSLLMMIAPVRLAKLNGVALVSPEADRRLAGAVAAAAGLLEPTGTLPAIGDGLTEPEETRQFFGDARAAFPDGPAAAAAECLLADGQALGGADGQTEAGETGCTDALATLGLWTHLPAGGYFVARSEWSPQASAVSVAVPDGSCDHPNHAHADRLTVNYTAAGIPIIADPASKLYLTVNQPKWRDHDVRGYVYSTEAHNVVLPHGRGLYSPGELREAWGAPVVGVEATVERSAAGVQLSSRHSGYPGIEWSRTVVFFFSGDLEVTDEVHGGSGQADHIQRWHFDDGVVPTQVDPHTVVADAGEVRVRITARPAEVVLSLYPDPWFETGVADSAPWILDISFGGTGRATATMMIVRERG